MFYIIIRGSDVDASLHYLARLIERGDYDIIYRRMSDVVYEDIGLANPMMGVKLNAAINNKQSVALFSLEMGEEEIVKRMCSTTFILLRRWLTIIPARMEMQR